MISSGVAAHETLIHRVKQVLESVLATDMHTHLYSPAFGPLLLSGADELLNHHYLIAEALRWGELSPDDFYAMGRPHQAEFVWKTLFLDHSPVSASGSGVLETFDGLGLDASSRDLNTFRAGLDAHDLDGHVDRVFKAAGIESAVMTNDPFDDVERSYWERGVQTDSRFHTALRLDTLVLHWDESFEKLLQWGYKVEHSVNAATAREVARFVRDWTERTDALYVALSLPPTWRHPDLGASSLLLEQAVLTAAAKMNRPVALMIGVKRQVNPALGLAGDSVGKADILSLERLCREHPEVRFLVTMLSRENQYELCVAARKFPNLMPFGCWWFLNIPYLIDEMTRMRLELLGTSVIPHHSDVRILEQVVPKWKHARSITASVLADKYHELEQTGWKVSDADIRRDAEDLFSRNFWRFLGK